MTEHPVSYHAAARYLERVHGMSHLAAYGRSDRDRVELGAERLGLTVDEVRDLVLPPRLHAAVRMGLKGYVKAGDRTLPIRNGSVVTCLEPEVNPRKQKQRRAAA